jgi:hypothetical protein
MSNRIRRFFTSYSSAVAPLALLVLVDLMRRW